MLNIRKYRIERNMSQYELANIINVTQSYIAQLESECTRRKSPTLHVLESISRALNVCICDLIDCPCDKCKARREEN